MRRSGRRKRRRGRPPREFDAGSANELDFEQTRSWGWDDYEGWDKDAPADEDDEFGDWEDELEDYEDVLVDEDPSDSLDGLRRGDDESELDR